MSSRSWSLRSCARRRLSVGLALGLAGACTQVRVAAADEAEPAASATPAPVDKRAEAERHFQRGLELASQAAWDAALAEFLTSRELFPTRSATRNAAIAQRQLGRHAESYELYQLLLREFSSGIPADQLASIRRELADARAHTAEIVIDSREPGVHVALDGRALGSTPLNGSVRVNAGTHRVRLSKDGFESSEETFTIAIGMKRVVLAQPQALSNTGRLVVQEANGRKLGVFVDGSLVGTTPWSAAVSSGSHIVQLKGDDGLGTAPGSASVRTSDTLVLSLRAVPLDASLRVEPVPSTATVYLDGVLIGAGVWAGALPSGSHRVEVTAAGHWLFRQKVELRPGVPAVLHAQLERDASSPLWQRQSPRRLYADVELAMLLADSLGGGAHARCNCNSLALGVLAAGRLGYVALPRLGLELGFGAVSLTETLDRSLRARSDTGLRWASNDYRDSTRLTGPWLGLGAAFQTAGAWPFTARLSAGAALLHAQTSSSGSFASEPIAGQSLERVVNVPEQAHWLLTPFIASELRLGYQLSARVSADVGLGLWLFLPKSSQRRGTDQTFGERAMALPKSPDDAATPGVLSLPGEKVAGAFLALSPAIGLKVVF
ncbi:MAG TPA: PEGA domain-containing protein [Polyangiaceae bacterium]|nr:PEGA domain-containing protein [Polyangiaceae bacterium]